MQFFLKNKKTKKHQITKSNLEHAIATWWRRWWYRCWCYFSISSINIKKENRFNYLMLVVQLDPWQTNHIFVNKSIDLNQKFNFSLLERKHQQHCNSIRSISKSHQTTKQTTNKTVNRENKYLLIGTKSLTLLPADGGDIRIGRIDRASNTRIDIATSHIGTGEQWHLRYATQCVSIDTRTTSSYTSVELKHTYLCVMYDFVLTHLA